MTHCRRTAGLIDRIVAGRVSRDDREHAATCASCGPVLSRAATFDDELRRSARSLVAEDLPRGVLDTPIAMRFGAAVVPRRAAPGLAATFAAIAILLAATAIALGPGTSAPTSPSRSASAPETAKPFVERFRSTDVIRVQLAKLGYACNDGQRLPSFGPGPDAVAKEATVCTAPDSVGPFIAAVIVGEAANGNVVELTIKADIVGDDTIDSRAAVAAMVAKVFAVSVLDKVAGQAGGAWAKAHIPQLEIGDDVDVVLHQVAFHASRGANAGYVVVARGAAAA